MVHNLAEKTAFRLWFLTYLYCCFSHVVTFLILYFAYVESQELRALGLQRFILTEELLKLRIVAPFKQLFFRAKM